jgi:hypothetical protein
MTRPLIQIDDEIREMNDTELANYEIVQAESLAREADILAKAEAKAIEKQALLDRLGITADEAALLLG